MKRRLKVTLAGLDWANPMAAASGCFGYGVEFEPFLDLSTFGAVMLKGLSLEPRPGNPTPRLAETPGGLLNSIGLENVGVDRFLEEKAPGLHGCGTVVVANILGDSADEFAEVARRLDDCREVKAVEVNISCPNIREGFLDVAQDPRAAEQVTRAVKGATGKPVLVKLSPNVTDIAAIARACEAGGADAVSAVNTYLGMAVDLRTRRSRLGRPVGGLSGPAIKPLALHAVRRVARAVKIPVIAAGGISTWEDAVEFLMVGAAAFQIGTINFIDPTAGQKIIDGLEAYCRAQEITNVRELVGTFQEEA